LNLVLLNSLLGRHWRWALGLNSRFLIATRSCGLNCLVVSMAEVFPALSTIWGLKSPTSKLSDEVSDKFHREQCMWVLPRCYPQSRSNCVIPQPLKSTC
jgi:hypothetical protein